MPSIAEAAPHSVRLSPLLSGDTAPLPQSTGKGGRKNLKKVPREVYRTWPVLAQQLSQYSHPTYASNGIWFLDREKDDNIQAQTQVQMKLQGHFKAACARL